MGDAVVLAEGCLATKKGKTAHGLIRHSMRDEIRAVIDSDHAGEDAGQVAGGEPVEIPVVADLEEAVRAADPETLYVGAAPVGGELPPSFVQTIEGALRRGMSVYSGMHRFLGDEERFAELAEEHGAEIHDVRRPPEAPRVADGRVYDLDLPRVLVTGTDCAVGKRTTATLLVEEARDRGLDAALVATGQTGIMIGADVGVVVDRLPSDFCAGEVERMLTEVADRDLAIVEGQGAILHPAYSAPSLGILHGAAPHVALMAHDPMRKSRLMFDHPAYEVASLSEEIALVERLGSVPVAGIAVNGGSLDDVRAAEARIARRTGRPAVDPVAHDPGPLLDVVLDQLANQDVAPDAQRYIKQGP